MNENEQQTDAPLHFKLHLNVLRHLGLQLYASAPSVLTELVANAWDADATTVHVDISGDHGSLIVVDDGHGMSRSDLQERFLSVGYNRRQFSKVSESGSRKVMGRKGIGKLAMFAIARQITVCTQAKGQRPIQFSIDVEALEEKAKENKEYYPEERNDPEPFKDGHGTKIVLDKLNRSVNRSEAFLVPRIARRFGILGPAFNFQVSIGDRVITRADARIYEHLQFLWYFDKESAERVQGAQAPIARIESLNNELAIEKLEDVIVVDGRQYLLRGFIGTVDVPSRLGPVDDESINKIALFAHGRLWQEDLLADIGNARYFNSYIVGEIHADFIDEDEQDRATSAREAVIQDDPLFLAIQAHVKKCLSSIRDQWDVWRTEINPDDRDATIAVMDEWVATLTDERDRKLAKRLVGSIDKIELYNEESRNLSIKKMLFRSTMVAFEKLRVRNQLAELENISDVLSPEFQSIFTTLDDVEETYFHDISKQRLEIIQAFDVKVENEVLEKIIQKFLLDHLWLLDPTWDRIQGTQQEEVRLSEYLKASCPDTEDGARIDIAYRNQSGRHVVVELKRPGVKPPYAKIQDQVNRYRRAVLGYVGQHGTWLDGGGAPGEVAIYFIISDKSYLDKTEENSLAQLGGVIRTYETLILTARATYKAYFDGRDKVRGRIESFLKRLQG